MNLYMVNDKLYTEYDENYSPPICLDFIEKRQLSDIQIIKAQKAEREEYAKRAAELIEKARRAREAEYFLSDREQYAREVEYARRAREAEYARRAREAEYARRICSPVTYIPHRLVVANNNPIIQRRVMLTNYPAPFYGGLVYGTPRVTTTKITRKVRRRK